MPDGPERFLYIQVVRKNRIQENPRPSTQAVQIQIAQSEKKKKILIGVTVAFLFGFSALGFILYHVLSEANTG